MKYQSEASCTNIRPPNGRVATTTPPCFPPPPTSFSQRLVCRPDCRRGDPMSGPSSSSSSASSPLARARFLAAIASLPFSLTLKWPCMRGAILTHASPCIHSCVLTCCRIQRCSQGQYPCTLSRTGKRCCRNSHMCGHPWRRPYRRNAFRQGGGRCV